MAISGSDPAIPEDATDWKPILTDEERASQEIDDDELEEFGEGGNDQEPAEREEAAEAAEAAGKPQPEAKPAEPAKAPDDATTEQPKPERAPREVFVPLLNRTVPADIDTRISEREAKIDALDKQLDEGEIDARDHRKQTRALDVEINDYRMQKREAEIAREITQKQYQQQWVRDFTSWSKANSFNMQNEKLVSMLDGYATELEDAKDRDPADSNTDILDKAYAAMRKDLGLAEPVKTEATAAPAKAAEPLPKRKPLADTKLPPSLKDMPAADNQNVEDGKFAHMARLSGPEYEKALAAMSPADQEAYLASDAA